MSYLLIPRLRIRAANAMAGNYAINAAPVMAINLFVHNLGLKTACRPGEVAIIHHDAQLLGEYGSDGFYDFHPQQRRGATFIDDKDYSSKNPHALSLQPSASCHITLSLLVKLNGRINRELIARFLRTARIAGGCVDGFGELESAEQLDDIQLPKGFWIVERSDLMRLDENPVSALIEAIGRAPMRHPAPSDGNDNSPPPLPESWLAATVLGYAMITPFAKRNGVRQADHTPPAISPPHAFCEPLLGLIQYVSTGDYGRRPIPFWENTWLQDDVFVVRQSQPS